MTTFQSRLVARPALVLIALLVSGFAGCRSGTVTLYAVGDHQRTVSVAAPSDQESLDRRKLRKAWRLYGETQYRVAGEIAETLFDTTCDAEARELAAVAETRLGNTCTAECGLREAIRKHPQATNLRKALIWQLTERGRYKAAEREAYRAAVDSNDLQLWDYLVVVRDKRTQASRWAFFWWMLAGTLLITVIASVAIVLGRQ